MLEVGLGNCSMRCPTSGIHALERRSSCRGEGRTLSTSSGSCGAGDYAGQELLISGGLFRLRASYFSLVVRQREVTKRKRTLPSAAPLRRGNLPGDRVRRVGSTGHPWPEAPRPGSCPARPCTRPPGRRYWKGTRYINSIRCAHSSAQAIQDKADASLSPCGRGCPKGGRGGCPRQPTQQQLPARAWRPEVGQRMEQLPTRAGRPQVGQRMEQLPRTRVSV